jgi:hypothetical protein
VRIRPPREKFRTAYHLTGWEPRPDVPGPTDDFLGLLGAIGSAEEAGASVRRYAGSGATSPCVGGISATGFDATLEALAQSLD